VARHHPAILRMKQELLDAGAVVASMSGSGSALFGLFDRPDAARRTASDLRRPGWHIVSTRTLSRREYDSERRRALAGSRSARIS
jgi:4-diphosphocytidyl-2C-methyl-D-erythritol kinase